MSVNNTVYKRQCVIWGAAIEASYKVNDECT